MNKFICNKCAYVGSGDGLEMECPICNHEMSLVRDVEDDENDS